MFFTGFPLLYLYLGEYLLEDLVSFSESILRLFVAAV